MKRLILTVTEFLIFRDNALKNNIRWDLIKKVANDTVVVKVKDCPMLELLGY